MPREFRKRGRGGKPSKKNKENGADDGPLIISALPAQVPRDVVELALEDQIEPNHRESAQEDLNLSQFPELNPDLRAYWRQIDNQIQELERLGLGSHPKQAEQDDDNEGEDEVDQRHLILKSALTELSGYELSLATDPETSIILERLIYSMDDFAKRVLMDRIVTDFVGLCRHRNASHVVQTLLALSAPVLEREFRGDIANGVNKSQANEDGELPAMYLLLSQACQDLVPHLKSLSIDSAGSHVLATLFLLISGKPIPEESIRSRKSSQWRSKKGPLRSVFHDKEQQVNVMTPTNCRSTPAELQCMADLLYRQMRNMLCDDHGKMAHEAASNPAMVVLLRQMSELEFERGEAEVPGSLADTLLGGLIKPQDNHTRSEFVEVCLRDATASYVFEGLITRLSPLLFSRFYSTYLSRRIGHLSSHPVANFIISKAISLLESNDLLLALDELKPKMIDCIDNYRIGPLKSLVERSISFGQSEQHRVTESLFSAFGVTEESKYTFPCLISLMRLDYFRKTTAHQWISSTDPSQKLQLPESNIQGSLLLQAILRQNAPGQSTQVIKGLMDLPMPYTIAISRDPIGSRTLDVLLNSPTIPTSSRRQFILRLIGHYHHLADDRIGSRIADLCWAVADVYLKEKIATSLIPEQNFLQRSAFAHYFLKKLELPLFERQRDRWKTVMSTKFPSKQIYSRSTPSSTEQSQHSEATPYVSQESPSTLIPHTTGEEATTSNSGTKKSKKRTKSAGVETDLVKSVDHLFESLFKKAKHCPKPLKS